MNEKEAINIVDIIFDSIFKKENTFDLKQIMEKFAFDIKLPIRVIDSIDNQPTWTTCMNSKKYTSQKNIEKYDKEYEWMFEKQEIKTLQDIINIWQVINYTTTERVYNSINYSQCDPLYRCENAFRCTNCSDSKNIIFSDGCINCTSILACQRTGNCNFCIRVDDSNSCNNSYNVICSAKINNSFFIQDCNNLYECMFCSHISNKRYCIANMQFEKHQYIEIKKVVIDWILKSE